MLYRHLWLGLLVCVFAVTAPAVVFYTAGYRWNPKKWAIERNGTLIFDTDPAGANVYLDDKLIGRTPLTRQDIAPGSYRVRLERDGRFSWEKEVDVRPERATFVTDIWLWNQAPPVRVLDKDAHGLTASPNGERLGFVEQSAEGPQLVIQHLSDSGVFGLFVGTASEEARMGFEGEGPTGTIRLVWDTNSTGILVEDSQGAHWVADVGRRADASALPQGTYRWDGGDLVGASEGSQRMYVPSEGVVRRTTLPEKVSDRDGSYLIQEREPGVHVVVEEGRDDVQFGLPSGEWTFAGRESGWLLLRDVAQQRWLAFDPRNPQDVDAVSIPTPEAPQRYRNRETSFLAAGGNELWMVTLGQPAELLLRSSELLTGASWHEQGRYVFYSTGKEVVALGLDVHNGRIQTTLATFDKIDRMTRAGTVLYVAGVRDNQRGVWMLDVE